ncbi:hypothetical protein [Streptomyces sp. NPDC057552]|uniref:hypothetical protein n=1 Tax=Streptomyces sp. NPDC057552 TaxID=3350537 RepID=UPI003678079A
MMQPSQKALDHGWGWVLGVSGEECRVRSRPETDHAAILAEVATILGVSDPTMVPAAVRRARADKQRAVASAAVAWAAVHALTASQHGEAT